MKRHKHRGIKSSHPTTQNHRSKEAQKYHSMQILSDEEEEQQIRELAEKLKERDWSDKDLELLSKAMDERPLLGQVRADIRPNETVLRLLHPSGGTAYAISYKSQKWATSLSGGNKPHIAGIGHYHKIEQLFYRNIHIFQSGTFEEQTPFMSRKQLAAHVGGWILWINKNRPIGLIGDTHLGSKYCNLDALNYYYDLASFEEGVQDFYHTGDMVCGENIFRGQVYEIHAHGLDEQLAEVVKNYPQLGGITTHFITGNHDLSFWNRSGADIGNLIDDHREDMNYLGQEEADITLYEEPCDNIRSLLVPFY